MRGDLVQMMLIQIQSIKHELMVAMEAVDQLLRENEFNLQASVVAGRLRAQRRSWHTHLALA